MSYYISFKLTTNVFKRSETAKNKPRQLVKLILYKKKTSLLRKKKSYIASKDV